MLTTNKKTGNVDWAFDGTVIPTAEQVQAEFLASKYKELYYLKKEIVDSINSLQIQSADDSSPPPAQNFQVAEKRDAEISFEFDKEVMTATINILSPYGGEYPTINTLKKALSKAGITNGTLLDVLLLLPEQTKDLKAEESLSEVIAVGKAPEPGKNAYIEFLTRSAKDRLLKPKTKDNGQVDMLDLGDPITVKPKQPLALRHPPQPGINGYTVTGSVILAQAGKDISIKASDGSEIDPKNPDQLLATKEGLPLLSKDSVSIDDVMVLKKVNVTTGHVRFNGSLTINGDVGEGMKVESAGNIHITGSVESAFITAGGSITINNGIIGRKQDDNSHQCSCEIKAEGDITAQFAQYALLESKKDVVLIKQSNHCQITAKNKVIIGSPEKANGRLIGGNIIAEHGLDAGEIGAPSGTKTNIFMATTYKKVKAQINLLVDKNTHKFEAMKLAAQRVKQSNEKGEPEMVLMALEEFKEYKGQAQDSKLELEMAKEQVERLIKETACLVNRKLHTNVSFTIGESTVSTSREHSPSNVHYVEGKLLIEPKNS